MKTNAAPEPAVWLVEEGQEETAFIAHLERHWHEYDAYSPDFGDVYFNAAGWGSLDKSDPVYEHRGRYYKALLISYERRTKLARYELENCWP